MNIQVNCILLFAICICIAVIPLDRLEEFPWLSCCFPLALPLWKHLVNQNNYSTIWIIARNQHSFKKLKEKLVYYSDSKISKHTVLWAAEPPYCWARASPIPWYISMRAAAMLLSASTLGLSVKPIAWSWRPKASRP